MHLCKVALLFTVAARLLRKQPPPQVLSFTNRQAMNDAVLGGLVAALKEGPGACGTYVNDTLRSLAAAYTKVQVPHVLQQVCNGGTFFHAFKDSAECQTTTDGLIKLYEDGGDYKGWCADVQKLLGNGAGSSACKCVAIPDAIERVKDGIVMSSTGIEYSDSYGRECKTHDLDLPGCDGEYKPAYCFESWCYVEDGCDAKDVKKSFFFGKRAELFYSYQNCGGIDAFAAEACAGQSQKDCSAFSDNCAWNAPSGSCQNKLCQCTGRNNDMDETALGFLDGYGESCKAWDSQTCEEWKEKGDGYNLGMWCCKDWCYVDESCPSAEASSAGEGLFYSYFACPDNADKLAQCPWKEPIDFGGEPLALSSDAAAALNDDAQKK